MKIRRSRIGVESSNNGKIMSVRLYYPAGSTSCMVLRFGLMFIPPRMSNALISCVHEVRDAKMMG